jgi:hypothetical protein
VKIILSNLPLFYINMEEDKDRRKRFVSWCKKYNFKNITRVPGVVSKPYFIGLNHAYINAIKKAMDSSLPFILFEDDALPTNMFEYEIEVPDDADAVYLGVSPWCFTSIKNPEPLPIYNGSSFLKVPNMKKVFKIIGTMSRHSILFISERYANAMIESSKKAIDLGVNGDVQIYLDKTFEKYNVYAIGPMFYQYDINKRDVTNGTKNIDMESLIHDR